MSNVTTITVEATYTSYTTYCPLTATFTVGNKTIVTSGSVTLPEFVTSETTVVPITSSTEAAVATTANVTSEIASSSTTASIISANSSNTTYSGMAAGFNGNLAGAGVVGMGAVVAFLL